MKVLSTRIEDEEKNTGTIPSAFQGVAQGEASYLLTCSSDGSGHAKVASAADLSELITLILALVPQPGRCRVHVVNTSDYSGCPDADDSLRYIGEGVYCRDNCGALVERIEEGLEAVGMGDALNRSYAQEIIKFAQWNLLV